MVVTPWPVVPFKLKVLVPTKLIPVAGEEPVVAPVMTHVTVVTPQLSAVTGLGVATVAVHTPAVVLATIFAGHVTVGAWLSTTVTLNEQVAVFPDASVTRNVLVVTPTGKTPPLGMPAI